MGKEGGAKAALTSGTVGLPLSFSFSTCPAAQRQCSVCVGLFSFTYCHSSYSPNGNKLSKDGQIGAQDISVVQENAFERLKYLSLSANLVVIILECCSDAASSCKEPLSKSE